MPEIDARERPERPIPSGRVNVETVFTIGFAMMALGLALLAWTGYGGATGTGLGAVMGGLGLGAAIVLYNRRHKDNPLSPVLMGICRVLVYVTAGLAVALELPTRAMGRRVSAALLPDRPYLCRQAGDARRGAQPVAARCSSAPRSSTPSPARSRARPQRFLLSPSCSGSASRSGSSGAGSRATCRARW